MKTTLNDVMVFRANAERYIQGKERSKFTYAIEKMLSRTSKIAREVSDIIEDLRVDHASVDDKGNLLVVNGEYVFTPAKKKEMEKKYRESLAKEVEVEPYDASDKPTDMRADWEDVLMPFVSVPKLEANKAEKAA